MTAPPAEARAEGQASNSKRSPGALDPWVQRLGAAALLILVLAILFFQLSLARTRSFDPDEFQHAHSAFLISQGQIPYRDYFEHHPPLLHFAMAPVIARLHPERDGAAAFNTLLVLRVLLWSIAFLAAIAHHILARRLLGSLGAALASLLLWSTLLVFEKTIEIRPDTPAFALLQVALLLLSRGGAVKNTLAACSALGLGLLFTQKLVFPILGIMVVIWLSRRLVRVSSAGERAAAMMGLLWPSAVCALYFLVQDGLPAFIEDVFLVNLRWKARLEPWPFLVSRFLEPNPFFALLGGLGLVRGIATLGRTNPARPGGEAVVFFSAASGLLGLVLLPVAWEQYYLLFLPQLAILGSGVLLSTTASLLKRAPSSAWVGLTVFGVSIASLASAKDAILNQRLRTGEGKERAIGLILDNSAPTDTVLDGYSGIGVFRPHAFRYFFLHAEMRKMLSEAEVRELEDGLETGAIAPRFVSGDSNLRALSPRVREYLDRTYQPTGVEPVEVSVFPGGEVAWDDFAGRFLGERPPARGAYVLVGDGWSERQSAGGRAFRSSWGKTSVLRFPVLDPTRPCVLRLSARAGADVPGLRARVRLNGREIGELALGSAFAMFDLPIEPGGLIRGLNRVEFSYPLRPAQVKAARTVADNSALALESLTLGLGPTCP